MGGVTHLRRLLLPLLATLALVLGGCGSSDGGGSDGSPDASSGGHNDADVAFASQMVPHHEQALQMVAMSQGRDVSEEFAALTQQIYDAQQPEIDEMNGWLDAWGEPSDSASGHDMDGMEGMDDMPGMGSSDVPGMMSDDDLAALTNADVSTFEAMWLQMMIAHHEGAIEMAKTELADGEYQPALDLAQSIVDSQTAEIEQMQQMLDQ